MEQTGSKSGKEYVEAVYCHSAYSTYMQSTSCKMPVWMKHKLESENQDHGVQSHHFMVNRWGINGNCDRLYFGRSKITSDGYCSNEIKRWLLLGRKAMANVDSILKSRNITNKGLYSQSYGLSCGPVCMWELDYKESWALKIWCFWTVVLEKTLER